MALAAALLLASVATGGVARLTLQALVILVAGGPLFVKAFAGLRRGKIGFPALMTVAVIGAVGLTVMRPLEGHLLEAELIVILNAISEIIEDWGLSSTSEALEKLLGQSERLASRWDGTGWVGVPISTLSPGDRIRVLPGDRIPVDAVIVEGQASVDQQALTGESVPAARGPGDKALAGTIPTDGALVLEAATSFDDSRLANVAKMIAEGAKHKSRTERMVDRFAAVFTPLMLAFFALANVYGMVVPGAPRHEIFYSSLVLLLISCPCAFVIASPVTMTSALAHATKRGVLVRGSKFIEAVARITGVVFDKTGTLTEGRPEVEGMEAAAGQEKEALAGAASLASASEHPLSRAIMKEAAARGVEPWPVTEARSLPGRGVVGTAADHRLGLGSARLGLDEGWGAAPPSPGAGHRVHLWIDGAHAAAFRLGDTLRPTAEEAVAELKGLDLSTAILSGDREENVAGVAERLGVGSYAADLLPEQKLEAIDRFTGEWGPLAMVGDGINDTPSLARASVGVAVGASGTELAMETADVVLMGDDLRELPYLVRLARYSGVVLNQNIVFALGAKFILSAGAMMGYVTLLGAAFADAGLALVVVLNGLRLRGPSVAPRKEG